MQKQFWKPKINYSYGPYNKFDDKEQWIRITEGCPHNCPFCYEPKEFKIFQIPKIVRNTVKIMDMNLLSKPESEDIISNLPFKMNGKIINYEMICGIDYRFLTQRIASKMFAHHFRKIRIAWDWNYKDQYQIKDAIRKLLKVGYKPEDIMIFMICNWKIPFSENMKKLDLCKVWNVLVSDCYYDNQTFPNVRPIHWTYEECKIFRKKCRKHNQLVNFKIDPKP